MRVKKYAGRPAVLFSILCACVFLAGCGEMEDGVQVTNLQVDKNGRVTSNIVEDFDKDFYAIDALQEMVQAEIDDYNRTHPDAVALADLKPYGEEEEKVLVSVQFATCEDYEAFNGAELFYGTVEQAQTAGFSLDVELVSASDGTKKIGEADILGMKDMHILIVRQSAQVSQVVVPEKVQYMTEGTVLAGAKAVTIPGPENPSDLNWKGELTYILMK